MRSTGGSGMDSDMLSFLLSGQALAEFGLTPYGKEGPDTQWSTQANASVIT